MAGARLPDDMLSLGGMAMQALWWETTSGFCPRCGDRTERLEGEWGKRCPACRYEHYPHLHPAIIVIVRDGDRVLLARTAGWAPTRSPRAEPAGANVQPRPRRAGRTGPRPARLLCLAGARAEVGPSVLHPRQRDRAPGHALSRRAAWTDPVGAERRSGRRGGAQARAERPAIPAARHPRHRQAVGPARPPGSLHSDHAALLPRSGRLAARGVRGDRAALSRLRAAPTGR